MATTSGALSRARATPRLDSPKPLKLLGELPGPDASSSPRHRTEKLRTDSSSRVAARILGTERVDRPRGSQVFDFTVLRNTDPQVVLVS